MFQIEPLTLFIISDSLGETAKRTVRAALAQFPQLNQVKHKRYSFINTWESLLPLLEEAKQQQAIVVSTLVDKELLGQLTAYAAEHHIEAIDLLNPMINLLSQHTQLQPIQESGVLHQIDQDYHKLVQAIEFAVHYDDGKNMNGLLEADIVLLGVSRTSKTPLSMYLAHKSYKVANIPLIPEASLPLQLKEVDPHKLFGLTASAPYIAHIRKERLEQLGLDGETQYNRLARVEEELAYAEKIYEHYGATRINIENKSIEETAHMIISALEGHVF